MISCGYYNTLQGVRQQVSCRAGTFISFRLELDADCFASLERKRRACVLFEQEYLKIAGAVDDGARLSRCRFCVKPFQTFNFLASGRDGEGPDVLAFRDKGLDIRILNVRDAVAEPVDMDDMTFDPVRSFFRDRNIQLHVVLDLRAEIARGYPLCEPRRHRRKDVPPVKRPPWIWEKVMACRNMMYPDPFRFLID